MFGRHAGLMQLTPDQAAWIRALAGSCATHFTPIVLLSTQVYTPDGRNVDPVKSINQERFGPMVFWVDSIDKLRYIPFFDNQDIFFL